MSDSVRPHRWQPTRPCRPWDSPGKNTGVGCHSSSSAWKLKVKVKSLSRVRLLATPWTAAYQAPPSMGFSRQEYYIWDTVISVDHAMDNVGVCFCETHELLKEKSGQISWVWSDSTFSLYDLGKSFCASSFSFINRDYSNSPFMGFLT